MKHFYKIALFLVLALLVALVFPSSAFAQPLKEDKVVFGDTYRLGTGETLDGNLAVFGGAVTLEKGSNVTGDVSMLGGAVDGDGLIGGNIKFIGGTLTLGDNAVVKGNVQTFGGTLRKSEKAIVGGKVTTGGTSPFQFNTPNLHLRPNTWIDLTPVRTVFGGTAASLFMAALAMLVALFWPKGTERVAHAMIASPALSGGIGCLTLLVAPALIILLTITIILSPVSLVGILLLVITFIFGWIAFGMEVGKRISQAFNVTWHPAANAGLGTLVVTLIVSWVSLIPFIGWLFGWLAPLLIVVTGLGGVLVTRFGTQTFPVPLTGSEPPTPAVGIQPYPQPPVPPAPTTRPEPPASTPDLTPQVSAMDADVPDLNPFSTASDAVIPDLNPDENPSTNPPTSPDQGTGTPA